MAEISSQVTFKAINQRIDRPFDWHVWELSFLQTLPATGDTILFPDRWDFVPQVLEYRVQKIVAFDVTTFPFDIQQVKINKSTGAVTNISNGFAGVVAQTTDTSYPGSGTATWAGFSTDYIANPTHIGGTHYAGLRISFGTRTGAGTAITVRMLVAVLMGRTDY